jgi:hypothetical protein
MGKGRVPWGKAHIPEGAGRVGESSSLDNCDDPALIIPPCGTYIEDDSRRL